MRASRELRHRGLLVAFGAVAAMALAEAGLRLTPYARLLLTPPRFYFVADPETGYDITPNAPVRTHAFEDAAYPLWSNELGCFDRPYEGERDYVLLVGDSYSHHFAPFERKWGPCSSRRSAAAC